jgi:hypothetical protein
MREFCISVYASCSKVNRAWTNKSIYMEAGTTLYTGCRSCHRVQRVHIRTSETVFYWLGSSAKLVALLFGHFLNNFSAKYSIRSASLDYTLTPLLRGQLIEIWMVGLLQITLTTILWPSRKLRDHKGSTPRWKLSTAAHVCMRWQWGLCLVVYLIILHSWKSDHSGPDTGLLALWSSHLAKHDDFYGSWCDSKRETRVGWNYAAGS